MSDVSGKRSIVAKLTLKWRQFHITKRTVYPPEARLFNDKELKTYEANRETGGKRDVFQDGNNNCTVNGGRVYRQVDGTEIPRGKAAGISLFRFNTQDVAGEAFKYAHQCIMRVVERQREIDKIDDLDKRDKEQNILNSMKCFTSSQLHNEDGIKLHNDRNYKDNKGKELGFGHTLLYPTNNISVAKFGRCFV